MKRRTLFSLLGLFLFAAPSLSGCQKSGEGDVIYLRILNSEDYIGEDEVYPFWDRTDEQIEANGEVCADVVSAFELYEKEVNNKNVRVIYDTFDTNETMLSSLKTGKSVYDLITPSDYTVQKMMSLGMLEPFDEDATPTYDEYASKYLVERLENITAEIGDGTGELHTLAEYSRGYMWGTLGVLYNPSKVANDKGLEEDEVKFDMGDWRSLWDKKYRLEMSVKDSMRDTYSVGIMEYFDEEIRNNIESSGYFDENYDLLPGKYEEALEHYSPELGDIFNRSDEETVNKIEKTLLALKENVFGFEVDSGKDDMIKGLIGMNLAWSGDAVYSMDRAENENDQYVYYSIPKTGGNIWFDAWVMPKSDSLHKEEAQEFVDFVSNPAIASANMDFIGYTSFIAGEDVFNLIREWYDPRSYAMWVYHDATLDGSEYTWEDSDFLYDENEEKVYQDGTGVHENGDDYGEYDMRGSTYEQACVDGVNMSWEEYLELINDGVEEDEQTEWASWNLTYMFEGTIDDIASEYTIPADEEEKNPMNDPYFFYTDQKEDIEIDGEVVHAGRQFLAQYPEQEMLPKLAVMKDYGENNKYVLVMWQNVKGNNLPVWGVVVFAIILSGILAFILFSVFSKLKLKKIKVARRKEAAARVNQAR